MTNPESSLPPGFRFHPTDEELILHYLRNKATSIPCPVSIIAEVDIYKSDPWDLPAKAMFGEKEWYYFSPRDRKYPNGVRPNRAAVSGYWKATGTDKPIIASDGDNKVIGVKKALVFYKGRPPKGVKTNWIMHEYRLAQTSNAKPMKPKDSSMRLDEWVLCRIYKKSTAMDREQESSLMLEASQSNLTNQDALNLQKSVSFSELFDAVDYSELITFEQNPTINTIFNNSNTYLLQRHQPVDPNSNWIEENQFKRARPISTNTEDIMLHPFKKARNSCWFSSNTSQLDTPQYNLANQQFLNQQLLLNSQYQL